MVRGSARVYSLSLSEIRTGRRSLFAPHRTLCEFPLRQMNSLGAGTTVFSLRVASPGSVRRLSHLRSSATMESDSEIPRGPHSWTQSSPRDIVSPTFQKPIRNMCALSAPGLGCPRPQDRFAFRESTRNYGAFQVSDFERSRVPTTRTGHVALQNSLDRPKPDAISSTLKNQREFSIDTGARLLGDLRLEFAQLALFRDKLQREPQPAHCTRSRFKERFGRSRVLASVTRLETTDTLRLRIQYGTIHP